VASCSNPFSLKVIYTEEILTVLISCLSDSFIGRDLWETFNTTPIIWHFPERLVRLHTGESLQLVILGQFLWNLQTGLRTNRKTYKE